MYLIDGFLNQRILRVLLAIQLKKARLTAYEHKRNVYS